VLTYYFLLRWQHLKNDDQAYHDAVRLSIQQGGDTDTNACIVGGMIGALVGVKNIPGHILDSLLHFDCMNEG